MLSFHPEALDELEAAIALLEEERPGHGALLFDEIVEIVTLATEYPESGTCIERLEPQRDVRAYALSRFRYRVIVGSVAGRRLVIAVAHASRAPAYWRQRVP